MPVENPVPPEPTYAADKVRLRRPCPICKSPRVYRSRRRGLVELALGVAGLKVRRCHSCDSRFIRVGESVLLVKDIRVGIRRIAQAVAVVVGVALVVAAVLWMIGRQTAE